MFGGIMRLHMHNSRTCVHSLFRRERKWSFSQSMSWKIHSQSAMQKIHYFQMPYHGRGSPFSSSSLVGDYSVETLMQQIVTKYDSALLELIVSLLISQDTSSVARHVGLDAKIVDQIIKRGSIEDIKALRLLTMNSHLSEQVNEETILRIVQKCAQSQNPEEAFQWLNLAHDKFNLTPERSSYSCILPAAIKESSWDLVYALMDDMAYRGIAFTRNQRDMLIKGAGQYPMGRWRSVRDLLLQVNLEARCNQQNIATTPPPVIPPAEQLEANDNEVASILGGGQLFKSDHAQYLVTPHLLCSAFSTLVSVHKYSDIRSLYFTLSVVDGASTADMEGSGQSTVSTSTSTGAIATGATGTTGTTSGSVRLLPIVHDALLQPLAHAAVALDDPVFFRAILVNNLHAKLCTEEPTARDSNHRSLSMTPWVDDVSDAIFRSGSEGQSVDMVDWLEQYSTYITRSYPRSYACGRQIGVLLHWMLTAASKPAVDTPSRSVARARFLGMAVSTWNDFVVNAVGAVASSVVVEMSVFQRAVGDVLRILSNSATAVDDDAATQARSKRLRWMFLRSIVLNAAPTSIINTGTAVSNSIACSSGDTGSIHSSSELSFVDILPVDMSGVALTSYGDVVDPVIALFADMQDCDSAVSVLTHALRDQQQQQQQQGEEEGRYRSLPGSMVSEIAMTQVLQLLQKQSDHNLVLEMFQLFEDVVHQQQQETAPSRRHRSSSSRKKAKKKKGQAMSPEQRGFAPYLYGVAMKSYAALSEFESMRQVITNVIPSRGYTPRIGFYTLAVHSLGNAGRYEEGIDIYMHACETYKRQRGRISTDRGTLGNQGRRQQPRAGGDHPNHNKNRNQSADASLDSSHPRQQQLIPRGYGIDGNRTLVGLIDAVLVCCAKGKHASTALSIAAEIDDQQRQGCLVLSMIESARIVELVVESLASKDAVPVLPQFLGSLESFQFPLVATERVLLTALAAAVSVADADTASEILILIRKNLGVTDSGVPVADFVNEEDLAKLVESTFGLDKYTATRYILHCKVFNN